MQPVKSLKILMVQETNWIERNVIQPHNILERLVQRGHSVQIVDYDILWSKKKDIPLRQPRQVFEQINRVIPDVYLKVTRPSIISLPLLCHASYVITSLIELRRVIIENRPDVVIGYSLTNSYPMALMLRRAGIPFLYLVLEPYHTMVPEIWLRPIARRVEGAAERLAQRVLIFTPQMRQYLLRMGVMAERIAEFRSGANLDSSPSFDGGQAKRRELGFTPDQWLILWMGWLYDFSGMREITRAIIRNPALLDGARLLIVGDGDIYPELNKIVEQHGLEQKIILTGKRPYSEIPSLLAAANVCLLPSLENDTTREIVPQKVFEYLAAGKPVVASRLPGLLTEFGQENGIVYTHQPEEAIKCAVSMAEEPELAHRLGQAGRRFAEENFDWGVITDQFEEMLRKPIKLEGVESDDAKGLHCKLWQ